uniref:Putative forkhead/hnf-3-related transcription factor n=1 Tax=Culex tarsalis TaxID=7177 RepID=A0A1Q3FS44_CULTA
MRRSTPPFPVMASGGGGGGGSASVVVPGEHYEQEHAESRHLKRKHSEERFTVAYHAYQEPGQSIHKVRKDSHLALPEVDHFHGFGQAFHGPSAEFQVIAASDGNNNQNHVHQEQQQLGYIYEVASGSSVPVVPVPHSQMISQDVPTSNGIVLTDISSSNWTSTQELLDLDRRTAQTIQTDSHNCFPIASVDHGQQPQQHHIAGHHHHPGHGFHGQPPSATSQFGNNHPKTQELTIVTSSGCVRSAGSSTSRRAIAPAGTPETPEDIEDKNLSWLFNFKLEDLPHLSPEAKRKQAPKSGNASSSSTSTSTGGLHPNGMCQPPESELDHVASGTAIEEDDLMVAENVTIENSTAAAAKATKKPPFTYTELIEYALEDKGELTVSGIYQWISDHFPFYKSNDDRWKNSVRHNLSINPHFRKGNKAPQGAGHLWTISSRDSEANFLAWEHKRQRLELFFKMEAANAKNQREPAAPGSPSLDETAAATASLAQYEPHSPGHGSLIEPLEFRHQQPGSSTSQHLQQQHQQMYANGQNNQFEVVQQQGGDDLKRSAGEILNGIRRNVEVQIVHPISSNNFQAYALLDSDYYLADYLNPVSKEEIVQECGLRSAAAVHRNEAAPAADYYITTIDPIELGINMSAGSQDEDQILFEDDFNLNYFGNNIMT